MIAMWIYFSARTPTLRANLIVPLINFYTITLKCSHLATKMDQMTRHQFHGQGILILETRGT